MTKDGEVNRRGGKGRNVNDRPAVELNGRCLSSIQTGLLRYFSNASSGSRTNIA